MEHVRLRHQSNVYLRHETDSSSRRMYLCTVLHRLLLLWSDQAILDVIFVSYLSALGYRLLAHLQQSGIHQGDWKPSNILISTHGNGSDRFKYPGFALTDFGHCFVAQEGEYIVAGPYSSKGTALYRAPEREKDIQHPRSDQYSFGRTLVALMGIPNPLLRSEDERTGVYEEALFQLIPSAKRLLAVDPNDRMSSVELLQADPMPSITIQQLVWEVACIFDTAARFSVEHPRSVSVDLFAPMLTNALKMVQMKIMTFHEPVAPHLLFPSSLCT